VLDLENGEAVKVVLTRFGGTRVFLALAGQAHRVTKVSGKQGQTFTVVGAVGTSNDEFLSTQPAVFYKGADATVDIGATASVRLPKLMVASGAALSSPVTETPEGTGAFVQETSVLRLNSLLTKPANQASDGTLP